MDRELALTLVDAGRMPVLAALLDAGTAVPFASPPAVLVGASWPTIWTGLAAGDHGRAAPEVLLPGTYDVVRWRPEHIGGTALWHQAARAGKRYVVVDVPHSVVGADAAGVEVVDWGSHDRETGRFSAWPDGLADELLQRFGPHPVESCDALVRDDGASALEAALLDGIERRVELATALLAEQEWDFAWIVFSESHCAGHHLWNADPAARESLLRVYEALDHALGALREELDGDDQLLVLLSHGIGPHHDGTHLLGEVLRRLDDAWARAGAWTRTAERVRRRLRRPASRPDGWVRTLDGSRSFFRAPNSAPYGAVRLNVHGREPRGRIAPGEQYEACLGWLTHELRTLANPAGPTPAVRRVLRTSDLHEGPALAWLPDLFVEWETDAPIEALESPTIGRVTGTYTGLRTGDHRSGGLLVTPGPATSAPEASDAEVDATVVARAIATSLGLELEPPGHVAPRFP
jgi:predicted AlkP superfamily phosphohydrolase/phosphomutase